MRRHVLQDQGCISLFERRVIIDLTAIRFHIFETPYGFCGLAWSAAGVTRFQLPSEGADATERLLLRRLASARSAEPTPEMAAVIAAVQRYFSGNKMDFSEVRVDLGVQDAFFTQVYAAARQIAWGQTTTYGALARQLGAGPEAARDVGQAMAKNPVPLIIPCHRVLAAGGKIGGFSAPGGSNAKLRMLELEGVRMAPPEPLQQSLF
ncbi:methylated-DNA--[protein]-cysteine S-methyltransferase [Rhizobium sp. CG5]|uniref:methylated-DNA--[protein]-cysteine S-methyltransferase n=1 Tax=Rhizobium sp. CG5 TaxID=2726076 RepID=UPI0020337FD8|nr:methylated-DNA--[protein]-cysteine S-methyltransferase [Rhizobium sp. CG5]MCM2476068.1 methylated-DNA--[protein]-cysteine S-methyltransferase [Rhizobium sp. CG5]